MSLPKELIALVFQFVEEDYKQDLIKISIQSDDLTTLKMYISIGMIVSFDSTYLASKLCKFSILKSIHLWNKYIPSKTYKYAIIAKRIDILNWLYSIKVEFPKNQKLVCLAMDDNSIVKWLYQHNYNATKDIKAIMSIEDTPTWILDYHVYYGGIIDKTDVFYAYHKGYPKLVEWLEKNNFMKPLRIIGRKFSLD